MLKDVEILTPKYIRSRIRSVKSFVPPLHIILLQTHSSLNSASTESWSVIKDLAESFGCYSLQRSRVTNFEMLFSF